MLMLLILSGPQSITVTAHFILRCFILSHIFPLLLLIQYTYTLVWWWFLATGVQICEKIIVKKILKMNFDEKGFVLTVEYVNKLQLIK